MKGRVALWNNSTNCGFIEIADEELFVHSLDLDKKIYEDEEIEFSIQEKTEGIFIYDLKEVIQWIYLFCCFIDS